MYWPPIANDVTFTPLLSAAHARKLTTFTRTWLAMVVSTSSNTMEKLLKSELIVRFIQTRVIPEIQVINGNVIDDAKRNVVRIALELLADGGRELQLWAMSTLSHWHREVPPWKMSFEKALESMVSRSFLFTLKYILRAALTDH